MGKIHIIGLFIFVLHVSLSKEINNYIEQNLGWTEVDGIGDFCHMHSQYSLIYC